MSEWVSEMQEIWVEEETGGDRNVEIQKLWISEMQETVLKSDGGYEGTRIISAL